MTTLLVIIWVILLICLVLHASVNPKRTKHSLYELKRLKDTQTILRERLLGDVIVIRQFGAALLVIIVTALSIAVWEWWGPVFTAIALVVFAPLVRVRIVRRTASMIYAPIEQKLLEFSQRFSWVGRLLGSDRTIAPDRQLESAEQLLHLVENSGHILDDAQRTIITNGIHWHTISVSAVMTPKRRIASIKHTEMLGPLVLNDLHSTGHTRFPVIRGSLNNVIGILDISELLEVTASKNSQTAEKVMSSQPPRINEHEPLPVALKLLQKGHGHILIVIDEGGDTVGLITLSDITSSLLGK